jgi:hypothetical protein
MRSKAQVAADAARTRRHKIDRHCLNRRSAQVYNFQKLALGKSGHLLRRIDGDCQFLKQTGNLSGTDGVVGESFWSLRSE